MTNPFSGGLRDFDRGVEFGQGRKKINFKLTNILKKTSLKVRVERNLREKFLYLC